MKSQVLLAAAVAVVMFGTVQAQDGLSSQKEKFSYALGYQLGNSLKRDDLDLDVGAVTQAIQDVLSGAEARLSKEQMEQAIAEARRQLAEQRQSQAAANKASGEKFLAENKTKQGVTETSSGLQYEVVKAGEGAKPSAEDTVVVHYRGTLLNGTEFDSSYSRNQPATLPLSGVIKGWQEGLPLMSKGAHYKFYIPAALGYGERGAGGRIGPNEILIFDVELLDIK